MAAPDTAPDARHGRDDDPIVPLVNSRLLAWRIPDARLHVVRGGGHLFLLERPADSADVVSSFLTAANPGPAPPEG